MSVTSKWIKIIKLKKYKRDSVATRPANERQVAFRTGKNIYGAGSRGLHHFGVGGDAGPPMIKVSANNLSSSLFFHLIAVAQ